MSPTLDLPAQFHLITIGQSEEFLLEAIFHPHARRAASSLYAEKQIREVRYQDARLGRLSEICFLTRSQSIAHRRWRSDENCSNCQSFGLSQLPSLYRITVNMPSLFQKMFVVSNIEVVIAYSPSTIIKHIILDEIRR